MPYIPEYIRGQVSVRGPQTAGELNYIITKVVSEYLRQFVKTFQPPLTSMAPTTKRVLYQHYNEAIGALEAAKLELYRRLVAPYEDEKARTHGEVFNVFDDEREEDN